MPRPNPVVTALAEAVDLALAEGRIRIDENGRLVDVQAEKETREFNEARRAVRRTPTS